jgi:molecular chaperone DnaK
MASDTKSLGTFRLDGIPPSPRGVPQIEVTFDIDANGILSVNAKDKGSGKEQSISITGASTLSDTEVDKMVRDAEANSAADKERREKIDLKNQAETLIYQSEKQLSELGDKVGAEDKAKVEGFVKELKLAVEKDDSATIKTTLEQLQQALYAAGAAVYQQAGAEGAGAAPGGNGNGSSAGASSSAEDVIDAEFTESK